MWGTRRAALLRRRANYDKRMLKLGPVCYFPFWEANGTVARCMVNAAQNGTYTGVTLADGIAPDGSQVPLFDGINDYVDCFSATLQGVFDGAEGSIAIAYRAHADSHNDSVLRRMLTIVVDANNLIILAKTGTNSNIQFDYKAGGTGEIGTLAIAAAQTSMSIATMTWSVSNDRVRYYNDGVFISADTVLGTWAGSIPSFYAGASDSVPNQPYHGWLGKVMLFDRELTQSENAYLADAR